MPPKFLGRVGMITEFSLLGFPKLSSWVDPPFEFLIKGFLVGHESLIRSIKLWEPENRRILFSCSLDQSLKIWEIFGNAGQMIRSLNLEHNLFVLNLDAEAQMLAVSKEKHRIVRFWLDHTRKEIVDDASKLETKQKFFTYFDTSFDVLQANVVFGMPAEKASLLSAENMRKQKFTFIEKYSKEVKSVRVGKRCSWILCGTASNTIFVSNSRSLKRVSKSSDVFTNSINTLRFFENETKFVGGCWARKIGVFVLHPQLKVIKTASFIDNIFTAEISKDNKYFAFAGWSNNVRVYLNE